MTTLFLILLASGLLILAAIYFGWKLIRRLSNKLSDLEDVIPLPPRPSRYGAILLGTVVYTTGIAMFFWTMPNWNILAPQWAYPSVEFPIDPDAPKAAPTDLFGTTIERYRNFDTDEFAQAAREAGYWRLDDLGGSVAGDPEALPFFEPDRDVLTVFVLRELFTSDTQPVWSGCIDRRRDPVGETLGLETNVWCGFDLRGETPKRACLVTLQMPVFQRLRRSPPQSFATNTLSLAAPSVVLRLDADRAYLVNGDLVHRNYGSSDTRAKIPSHEKAGLAFTVQGESTSLPLEALLEDSLTLTIRATDTAPDFLIRPLWSRRELRGKDRFLFAGAGEPGKPDFQREIPSARILHVVHDFLRPEAAPLTTPDEQIWVTAIFGAKAVEETPEDAKSCRDVIPATYPHPDILKELKSIDEIQPGNVFPGQIIEFDRFACDRRVGPLLFLNKHWGQVAEKAPPTGDGN